MFKKTKKSGSPAAGVKKSLPLSNLHNPLKVGKSKLSALNVKDLRSKFKKTKWNRKTILKWGLRVGVAGIIGIVLLSAWYAKDLPTPQGIRHNLTTEETTKIYDRTGQHLLYAISAEQRRISVPMSELPPYVKDSFVALEDKNFYKHYGLDLRGIARSVYYDITRRTLAYGGSTITQQLAKNAIIQSNKKYFDRKIREAILSIEIEAMFSKDKILELYLNEIPFGGQIYGIEVASQTYFGKKAKDLTIAESATLAAMIQRPTYYSPYGSHTDRLIIRRDYAIDRMQEDGYITQEQAKTAKEAKLVTVPRRDTILAPHFVMYVRDIIAEKYGEEIFAKGLTITTSLDVEQQKAAETAVATGATQNREKYGIDNAALVSLNPKTGEVLAMVGSVDYFNNETGGQFNVATAERQPGSAFKPLVYAAALKQKYNPASIFYDLPTDFGKYKPNNFDGKFRGPITMRDALGQSLNIPAVKALGLVGVKEGIKTATDLGITTLDSPEKYGLSLVLGAAEVKPIELAQAYGVFANGGIRQDIAPIVKIVDHDGKTIEEFKAEKGRKQVIDPAIAFQMSDMMADQNAKAPVFGNLLSFGNRKVASKTGTTNGITNGASDVRDAWTVGYTPSIVTAIWTGNNDHSPLGKGVLAANAAVPIFKSYMNAVLPSLANENFYRPDSVKTITVDKLSNKLPGDSSPPDQRITDVFANWQIPTKTDDVHVKVRLCKGTDLLANDETPVDQTEEKFYASVRSEKPDDPAWEGPVQAWAQQNGLNNRPPTGKCDTFTADNRPQVSFVQPTPNATVSDAFTIQVNATSQFTITQVEFFIDGISIGVAPAAPYQISYNAKQLSNGSHAVAAEAKDNFGRTTRISTNITVDKEATAPDGVSKVTVIPGRGQATLNWTNPGNFDVTSARLYISEVAEEIGFRYATEPVVTPGSNSTFTITGLTSGKMYYFTIHPVDTNGNENQSPTQYSTVVL